MNNAGGFVEQIRNIVKDTLYPILKNYPRIVSARVISIQDRLAVVRMPYAEDDSNDFNAYVVTSQLVSVGDVVNVAYWANLSTAVVLSNTSTLAAAGGGESGNYNNLENKPSINSVTLLGNKTPADFGLYGTNNAPPYPVKSVNTKIGDVVLAASDVGAVSKAGDTMTGDLTVGSAKMQTNGYVTGTWLRSTANIALSTKPSQIAVVNDGWVYTRTPEQIADDIGAITSEDLTQTLGTSTDKAPSEKAVNDAISAAVSGGLPSGVIMMWSGAASAIPTGWVLCDGTNSTPDLRNRFVIGAGRTYAVGAIGGGSKTTYVGDVEAGPQAKVSTSALPPFYALCYIMKT